MAKPFVHLRKRRLLAGSILFTTPSSGPLSSRPTPTIGVGLLDNGPELGVVNKIEPARRRRFRRCTNGLAIVHSGERGNGLLEDVEQSLDDLGRRRPFEGTAGC